jgi:nucleoid-associated protein YgaU
MQQIERYGVIALLLLLITVLAVSFWGDGKEKGMWSRFFGKDEAVASAELAPAPAELPLEAPERRQASALPLSPNADPLAPPIGDAPAPAVPPAGEIAGAFDPNAYPGLTEEELRAVYEQWRDTQAPLGALDPLPAPAPAPVAPPPATYVVQSGDTLAGIASKLLGDANRWSEIQALNAGIDPKKLRAGQSLALPAGAAAPKQASAPSAPKERAKPSEKLAQKPAAKPPSGGAGAGGRTYVVRAGDALTAIARRELGDASRWREIAALNPKVDPDRLLVGQSLALPAGAKKAAPSKAAKPEAALAVAPKKNRVQ